MDNVTCCDIPMRMLSDCWLRPVQDALCKVTDGTLSLAVISPCLAWSGRRKGLGAACPFACSIAGSMLKTECIGLIMLNRIVQQQIALTEVWLRYRKLNLTHMLTFSLNIQYQTNLTTADLPLCIEKYKVLS